MSATMPEQSERQFQAAVLELAQRYHWRTCHFNDSRRALASGALIGDKDAAGWPDLVLVREGWMVIAELKRDNGRCSPQQEAWLLALSDVEERTGGRLHVAVWRPKDWEAIARLLRDRGRR